MWVDNFNKAMAGHFGFSGSVTDYLGSTYSYSSHFPISYSINSGYSPLSYYTYAHHPMPIYKVFAPNSTATALGNIGSNTVALMCGSGTDAETYSDYTITEISGQTHIGYSNGNVTFDKDTRTYSATIKRILRNDSGENITVTEVGLFTARYRKNNDSTGSYLMRFMLNRQVLENPITVENGEQYVISMNLKYTDNGNINGGTTSYFDKKIYDALIGTDYANSYMLCCSKSADGLPTGSGTPATSCALIVGGSGTDEVAYTDQSISYFSDQTHIDSRVVSTTYNSDTHTWTRRVSRTLQNDSGEEIVISEIGWYGVNSINSYTAKADGYNDYKDNSGGSFSLIQRKVLETPLTVPAGAIYTLIMDMSFTAQRED